MAVATRLQSGTGEGGNVVSLPETELTTAARVANFMFEKGLAQVKQPQDTRAWIDGQLYKPQY